MKKTDNKTKPNPPTIFSDDFKIKIITEYLETDLTKREILDKYGIRSNSPIQKWMRKLGIIDLYCKPLFSAHLFCYQIFPDTLKTNPRFYQ